MLAHHVYFSLHDSTPEKVQRLTEECRQYLADHPGTVFFAVGGVAEQYARPVNDRDFDVALHVVFASEADHDAYQVAPLHQEFIARNKATWSKVRVFDSLVE